MSLFRGAPRFAAAFQTLAKLPVANLAIPRGGSFPSTPSLFLGLKRPSSLALFTSAVAIASATVNQTASCSPENSTEEAVTTGSSKEPKITLEGIIQPDTDDETVDPDTSFPADLLFHDHYNGVTIHLENCTKEQEELLLSDPQSFQQRLQASLERWRQQGKKGIWIHCPVEHAAMVPIATQLGFDFHTVHNKQVLLLSQWLPTDTPNKLPNAATHQVGVGCVVFCPWDSSKMLVVQEKTGPAAAYGLWKMPTGLSDTSEDVHEAAPRELLEETGLTANFAGILVFRQAHSSRSGTRTSSDLFFVCQMKLQLPDGHDGTKPIPDEELFQACPDEIAAIQWMSVEDYCNQERWQTSPTYLELNNVILRASRQQEDLSHVLIDRLTLPLGFGSESTSTNTLYFNTKL